MCNSVGILSEMDGFMYVIILLGRITWIGLCV